MYFQQAAIVKAALPEESDRTQLFANIDLATQVLTLVAQLFLSSFILRFGGVAVALMVLPVIYLGSFSTLAYNSSLQVMVIAVVIGRAAGYGITVPAREVLFTVVKREDKYKSKGFIDTVVLRGSDAASASTFTGLEGLGLRALNLCLIPVVVIWIFVSWRLGRFQEALAGTQEPETEE
jgi:AAA family ATP:ADP antiporter